MCEGECDLPSRASGVPSVLISLENAASSRNAASKLL